jgi:hypothetical protein
MKALAWVNPGEYLWEYAPTKRSRLVITTDTIVNYVKAIHKLTDHLGGGETWLCVRDRFYGILRVDVIFLFKRCPVCTEMSTKQLKGLSLST